MAGAVAGSPCAMARPERDMYPTAAKIEVKRGKLFIKHSSRSRVDGFHTVPNHFFCEVELFNPGSCATLWLGLAKSMPDGGSGDKKAMTRD